MTNGVRVVVAKGVEAVTVVLVIPQQEHALEYLEVPEQNDAYAGIAVG